MKMQQLPFASQSMSQTFSQTMPQAGLKQSQQLQSSNQKGASKQTTVPKQAQLTLGKEREEHDSQQMEKVSNDEADSDSELGSDTRRGVNRGGLQINTSIINGIYQLGKCLSSGKTDIQNIRMEQNQRWKRYSNWSFAQLDFSRSSIAVRSNSEIQRISCTTTLNEEVCQTV
ncbi:MAG: hypothetical protein EZS28_041947 [Streblomastix strix]|uniref:Uncharacterized protein n=1 Tax=Streblomastix strix TaxID=222440 RepID=A0A5J4TYM7_9EUKA|nr:MAG: hypothetical protein EZS28_041947 [Streblomastix strix]